MKIRKYLKSNENPLIKASMIGLYSPVCTTEFQEMLIDHIKSNYGSLYIRQGIEQDVIEDMNEGDDFNSELANEIRSICSNLYLTNQYKYENLYESTKFDYNPIENYNMVERGTDVVDRKNDQTFTKGSEIDTIEYGEDKNVNETESSYGVDKTTNVRDNSYGESVVTDDRTLTYGSKEHTTNYGVTKETDSYGQKQITNSSDAVNNATEHKVAPFDSTTAYTKSSDSESLGAKSESTIERPREDTHSADSHVDKVTDTGYNDSDSNTHTAKQHSDKETNVNTRDAHIDNTHITNTRSSHTDTNTQGERSDITTETGKDSTEHNFTRTGNIGVTTTQDMIVSQRKLVMFNFCSIVAKDIISKIADRLYSDDEEDIFYGYYS